MFCREMCGLGLPAKGHCRRQARARSMRMNYPNPMNYDILSDSSCEIFWSIRPIEKSTTRVPSRRNSSRMSPEPHSPPICS